MKFFSIRLVSLSNNIVVCSYYCTTCQVFGKIFSLLLGSTYGKLTKLIIDFGFRCCAKTHNFAFGINLSCQKSDGDANTSIMTVNSTTIAYKKPVICFEFSIPTQANVWVKWVPTKLGYSSRTPLWTPP